MIRQSQIGEPIKYPNFDHKLKDPMEDAISIEQSTEIIIVEGLYVFDRSLPLNTPLHSKVWDFKIWVSAEISDSMERVAKYALFYCQTAPRERN
jgi:pantothenate kinase